MPRQYSPVLILVFCRLTSTQLESYVLLQEPPDYAAKYKSESPDTLREALVARSVSTDGTKAQLIRKLAVGALFFLFSFILRGVGSS